MKKKILWTWTMNGYTARYGFSGKLLSIKEAERTFQLDPEPPEVPTIDDCIVLAQQHRNLDYFSFYLHHYERKLNERIYRFLHRNGEVAIDPDRFLDIKMACMDAMMVKVLKYDPTLGTPFAAYVSRFIEDALLRYRMQEESWSYKSLDTYKKVRRAAWLYHTLESKQKAIAAFAEEKQTSIEKAETYVDAAMRNRRRQPLYLMDEDGNETGDVAGQSDFPEMSELIQSYSKRESVSTGLLQQAFAALKDDRDKDLIEGRIGCCMECGSQKPIVTFEELAMTYEFTSPSAAKIAYDRALEKMAAYLQKKGVIRVLTFRRTQETVENKKIATAVYEYQADNDGEWGEIYFDFRKGTAEICWLADWDTTKSHIYAKAAIDYLLSCPKDELPKKGTVTFGKESGGR